MIVQIAVHQSIHSDRIVQMSKYQPLKFNSTNAWKKVGQSVSTEENLRNLLHVATRISNQRKYHRATSDPTL